ncbi:MAG: hypothetical protein OQK82_03145 [Candidatus Pacearchaeota archaeon]|nr:hypothetical protein [Candidatus Pacearchaeota archaeon]
MRKIQSKHRHKREERIKQIIIGGILILIMFTSVLGYAFQSIGDKSDENKIDYNGFKFEFQNNYWILENTFAFKYNPKETEDFYVDNLNLIENYQDEPLYIYSEYNEAENEIYRNLYNFAQRIQNACLNDSSLNCNPDWPVKSCDDNFILISEGNFNVTQNNNCLFIIGPRENLTKISDEVLYNIIGVK